MLYEHLLLQNPEIKKQMCNTMAVDNDTGNGINRQLKRGEIV